MFSGLRETCSRLGKLISSKILLRLLVTGLRTGPQSENGWVKGWELAVLGRPGLGISRWEREELLIGSEERPRF